MQDASEVSNSVGRTRFTSLPVGSLVASIACRLIKCGEANYNCRTAQQVYIITMNPAIVK